MLVTLDEVIMIGDGRHIVFVIGSYVTREQNYIVLELFIRD